MEAGSTLTTYESKQKSQVHKRLAGQVTDSLEFFESQVVLRAQKPVDPWLSGPSPAEDACCHVAAERGVPLLCRVHYTS